MEDKLFDFFDFAPKLQPVQPLAPRRKGLRPLSQSGLHRIPRNAKQRRFLEGGTKPQRSALDLINEKLAASNRVLHPTKGFRKYNAKSTAAAVLAAEIKGGIAPFSMKLMRRTLAIAQVHS